MVTNYKEKDKNQAFMEKFNRLIDRFIKAKVIPFIGAGVSNNAEHKYKNGVPVKVGDMRAKIVENIIEYKNGSENGKKSWIKWCCDHLAKCNQKGQRSGTITCYIKPSEYKMCPLFYKHISFSNLCEIFTWICPQYDTQSLADLLEIKKFTGLKPTFAHRYMAFLAREGVIDEIITTNYDTLIEKAYEDTFGDEANQAKPAAKVITNLSEYRTMGGAVYEINQNDERLRCLKIYKINGCAKKYEVGCNDESILLTERQLQDWRERFWAKDLFKDRLRSRTLLFSGFGSDEPQVRHTALQVAEEFSSDGVNNAKPDHGEKKWWDYLNSPFIAAFEPNLSFNQIQILYAYAEGKSKEPKLSDINNNAFTGEDGCFFGKDGELPADCFWERVYSTVFSRLLKEQFKSGSNAYMYLSSVHCKSDKLLYDTMKFYDQDLPNTILPLLLKIEETENYTTPLSRWVYYIRYGRQDEIPQGWYTSLSDKPILITLLLLFIYLFLKDEKGKTTKFEEIIFEKEGYFGFKTTTFDKNTLVLLTHSSNAFKQNEEISNVLHISDISIIQLYVSNSYSDRPEEINVKIHSEKNIALKTEQLKTIYKLPVLDVLKFMSEDKEDTNKELNKILEKIIIDSHIEVHEKRPKLKDGTKILT